MVPGTKIPRNESSQEQMVLGTKVPHRDYWFLGTKGHEKFQYPCSLYAGFPTYLKINLNTMVMRLLDLKKTLYD